MTFGFIEYVLLFEANAAGHHLFPNLSTYLANSKAASMSFAGISMVQAIVVSLGTLFHHAYHECECGLCGQYERPSYPQRERCARLHTLLNGGVFCASNLCVVLLAWQAPLCIDKWMDAGSVWAPSTCNSDGHSKFTQLVFLWPLLAMVVNLGSFLGHCEGKVGDEVGDTDVVHHLRASLDTVRVASVVEVFSVGVIYAFFMMNGKGGDKDAGLIALAPLVLELLAIALLLMGGGIRTWADMQRRYPWFYDFKQHEIVRSRIELNGRFVLAVSIVVGTSAWVLTPMFRGSFMEIASPMVALFTAIGVSLGSFLFLGVVGAIVWLLFYFLLLRFEEEVQRYEECVRRWESFPE